MKKAVIILLIGVFVALFLYFDLGQYLSLDYLKSQKKNIEAFYTDQPQLALLIYFVSYVLMATLSLPGAAILTLAGGAMFGLINGTIVVSFASTIGATLAFWISRTLLRDKIQTGFADSLISFNQGIEKDGAFYLFTLRLVPAFPFFVVNLVMGLTTIKTTTFYWVSQLGMLAGTLAYVNAGTQLSKINSLSDVLSPSLIGSFVILGLFPLVAKKTIELFQSRAY